MNNSFPRVNQKVKEILEKNKTEPAFEGTVLEGKQRRYTVINESDRARYLSEEENQDFESALFYYLGKIEEGRAKEGKEPYNSYVVINVDEPYTNEVVEIMKCNGHRGD